MNSKRIVLLTGPPGAGKGTQAELLAARRGWDNFSIGQLLRETVSGEIRTMVESGQLLPAKEVVQLVFDQLASSSGPVIVDGFPRRLDQAQEFEVTRARLGYQVPLVIHLYITAEESWNRLISRGRVDDARVVWERRWEEYTAKTLPAVAFYKSSANLIEVDGSGDIPTVAELVEEAVRASEDR
ncbi:MAG: nucleoside monophosphate kinase [Candidatus Saccharimonadales bacterium]